MWGHTNLLSWCLLILKEISIQNLFFLQSTYTARVMGKRCKTATCKENGNEEIAVLKMEE